MRVFVLGTGRCGSVTVSKACKHIVNYTSAHESSIVKSLLNFPDKHIEVSPYLTWLLGPLGKKINPQETFFLHLQRKKEDVVKSWMARGRNRGPGNWTILSMKATPGALSGTMWKKACELCYDSMVGQIEMFLKQQPNKMHIWLHELEEKWPEFWKAIEAKGDYQMSLKEIRRKYNSS